MTFTVAGTTYDVSAAPKFVRYAIHLITQKWGTNLDKAPKFAAHRARDLGRRFGTSS